MIVAGRDDGKFVAAQTRYQIVFVERTSDPTGDFADQFVPDRVPQGVVDVLEVIEVDIEDGGCRAALLNLFDDLLEPLAKIDAIGQAAERVVHGEVMQSALA